MERRKSEQFTDVLYRYLRQEGLETPLNEHRIVSEWKEVAGPVAERFSEALYVRNQTLHVKVRSAVYRAELLMQKSNLVKALNDKVKAQVISNIVFE